MKEWMWQRRDPQIEADVYREHRERVEHYEKAEQSPSNLLCAWHQARSCACKYDSFKHRQPSYYVFSGSRTGRWRSPVILTSWYFHLCVASSLWLGMTHKTRRYGRNDVCDLPDHPITWLLLAYSWIPLRWKLAAAALGSPGSSVKRTTYWGAEPPVKTCTNVPRMWVSHAGRHPPAWLSLQMTAALIGSWLPPHERPWLEDPAYSNPAKPIPDSRPRKSMQNKTLLLL